MRPCEFLIIGSGILGLTVANELLERGYRDIVIIEKENRIGKHASGLNSGVLHAGIYYTPDSLKARYCVEGNALMKAFCKENGVSINHCGKVLVADSEDKLENLKEIKKRADKNGVRSVLIDEKELSKIEPHAYSFQKALYSPDTAVFDPLEILNAFKQKILSNNRCAIEFGTQFQKNIGNTAVLTNKGKFKFNTLINASGTFADVVAKQFGIAKQYQALPFLGTYSQLKDEAKGLVNGNIYPVPDIRNPFLGVHFTKSMDGKVYLGPTAIPALGRESYNFYNDLTIESINIVLMNIKLFFRNEAFRENALSETKKYFGQFLFNEARKLVPDLKRNDIVKSRKVGIRPQLIDTQKNELVMDFKVIKEANTVHILNAISPAFTSSMAFAKYVCDLM